MRTFDNQGRLLGDTAAVPPPLVTIAPAATVPAVFNWQVLLEPPLVYFVAIGIGLAAYLYERNRT